MCKKLLIMVAAIAFSAQVSQAAIMFSLTSNPLGNGLTQHILHMMTDGTVPINGIDLSITTDPPGQLNQVLFNGQPTAFQDFAGLTGQGQFDSHFLFNQIFAPTILNVPEETVDTNNQLRGVFGITNDSDLFFARDIAQLITIDDAVPVREFRLRGAIGIDDGQGTELRIEDEVVGIPEPASLALLMAGGFLIQHRRRPNMA